MGRKISEVSAATIVRETIPVPADICSVIVETKDSVVMLNNTALQRYIWSQQGTF